MVVLDGGPVAAMGETYGGTYLPSTRVGGYGSSFAGGAYYGLGGAAGGVAAPTGCTATCGGGEGGCAGDGYTNTMAYVGGGLGEYQRETTYKYVGAGAGEYGVLSVPNGRRCNYCLCICLVLSLLLVPIVGYELLASSATTTPPP